MARTLQAVASVALLWHVLGEELSGTRQFRHRTASMLVELWTRAEATGFTSLALKHHWLRRSILSFHVSSLAQQGQNTSHKLLGSCSVVLGVAMSRQRVNLTTLCASVCELRHECAALQDCLIVSGYLRPGAFLARVHKRRFDMTLSAHPCKFDVSLPDVLSQRELRSVLLGVTRLGNVSHLSMQGS